MQKERGLLTVRWDDKMQSVSIVTLMLGGISAFVSL